MVDSGYWPAPDAPFGEGRAMGLRRRRRGNSKQLQQGFQPVSWEALKLDDPSEITDQGRYGLFLKTGLPMGGEGCWLLLA